MKDAKLFLRILYLVIITPFLLEVKNLPALFEAMTAKGARANHRKDKIVKYTDFLLTCFLPIIIFPRFRNHCLRRSLILYKFLGETGVDTRINIGIRKDEKGRIRGHCWLTLNDRPYLCAEDTARSFTLIYAFPPREPCDRPIDYRRIRFE